MSYNDGFWVGLPYINWFFTDTSVDSTSYVPSFGATEWFYTDGDQTLFNSGTYGFASFTMA